MHKIFSTVKKIFVKFLIISQMWTVTKDKPIPQKNKC